MPRLALPLPSNQENRRFCTVLPTCPLGVLFGISIDITQCTSLAVLLSYS